MKRLLRQIGYTTMAFVLSLSFTLQPGIASALAQPTGQIDEFDIPGANSGAQDITTGPDGNLWFTETVANKISRMTPTGIITAFDIPTEYSDPKNIIAGPDGNLWFTEDGANKIGRITPSGVIDEFDIPTEYSNPSGITVGPDGSMWFTAVSANKIGRITPAGIITEFNLPTAGSEPASITTGPDGNLWYTAHMTNKIGRITPAGIITEFDIPSSVSVGGDSSAGPLGITTGPDGNLWFTELYTNKIGRITPAGIITEFDIPSAGLDIYGTGTSTSFPTDITTGPDGNLWFSAGLTNKIGSITPNGVITEFNVPTQGIDITGDGDFTSYPAGITTGPDGNIWFVEQAANKIGVLRFSDSVENVLPTVEVNSDTPIEQSPIILKRPTFSGVATPGAQVVVTVRSDPISCSATADSSGNWSCTLPTDLEPGSHTVSVVVTNPDGSVQNIGPYQVTVDGVGSNVITNATPLAPNAGVYSGSKMTIVLAVTGLAVTVLIFMGLFYIYKQRLDRRR